MICDSFVVGQKPRFDAAFRLGNTLADPTVVKFIYQREDDDDPTVLTYGEDIELVRDSVGKYHVDLPLDTKGKWKWRWESTGTVESAEQGTFRVKAEDPEG